eukprot:gene18869-24655_t
MNNKRRSLLSISTTSAVDMEESFVANGDVFIKDNVAIDSTGIAMRNNPKVFSLAYDELELGEIIGRGCSSIVIYGIHSPTGTPLALKVINLFDRSKRDQLIREIATLYDAQCPNLITFYGAFYREGAITIALEYMDGGSLANVLDQVGPIPERALAGISFQILWGLAYMKHDKRVHRDVKPSNLLINSKGEAKVSDFGVSAELQTSIAMCGTFVGTFKYMSPERIRNLPYSYASDIWSFGLVVMECATGNYPYVECSNCIEMAQTILETDIPDLPPSRYSQDLKEFLKQILQRDPSRRSNAESLLNSSWLKRNGATSPEAALRISRDWILSLTGK